MLGGRPPSRACKRSKLFGLFFINIAVTGGEAGIASVAAVFDAICVTDLDSRICRALFHQSHRRKHVAFRIVMKSVAVSCLRFLMKVDEAMNAVRERPESRSRFLDLVRELFFGRFFRRVWRVCFGSIREARRGVYEFCPFLCVNGNLLVLLCPITINVLSFWLARGLLGNAKSYFPLPT